MRAADDVLEEALGGFEPGALRPDAEQPRPDDLGPAGIVPREHRPDLGQAHADALAGPHDVRATEVLLRVLPVPGRGPIRNDDPGGVPVPEHVGGDPGPSRGLADLHADPLPLDFRST